MTLGEDDSVVEEVTVVVGMEFHAIRVEEEHAHEVGDGGG